MYRFTQLPGGTFTVKFELTGFTTLNIEAVNLVGGGTMTINGKLEVVTLQETVTVTSQAPTIDLESSKVAVNWDQQNLDDLPYSRSLTSLITLVPGLYATSYDVGGSNFGTGSGPTARTFGRTGGNVVMYDGMVWDQTYGDYASFEEAQITTASKGADAMNPGLSMNLVISPAETSSRGPAWRSINQATCRAAMSAGAFRERVCAWREQVHVAARFLRRTRRSHSQGQTVVLRELSRRQDRSVHSRLHSVG